MLLCIRQSALQKILVLRLLAFIQFLWGMVQLECDTVLEHLPWETKGTFPFKKSPLPVSIVRQN